MSCSTGTRSTTPTPNCCCWAWSWGRSIRPLTRDSDGDGVPDALDQCPNDPEDKDAFADEDGCPDPDNDKDGIPDLSDKCPNEPETVNGIDDGDGCPDQGVIEVKEERLSYEERVLFATNRARVLPAGRPILEAIVHMWKQHPEWERLVIEGHTDKRGPEDFNNWLSKERAERTRRMLVDLGFPPDKVEVAGYGERVPRKEGDSEADYQANRRVEFVIVRKREAPAAPGTTASPAPTGEAPLPGPTEPPPAGSDLSPPPM
jgi:outer membrane protein OmpA-like peptidoglycan-associated protein